MSPDIWYEVGKDLCKWVQTPLPQGEEMPELALFLWGTTKQTLETEAVDDLPHSSSASIESTCSDWINLGETMPLPRPPPSPPTSIPKALQANLAIYESELNQKSRPIPGVLSLWKRKLLRSTRKTGPSLDKHYADTMGLARGSKGLSLRRTNFVVESRVRGGGGQKRVILQDRKAAHWVLTGTGGGAVLDPRAQWRISKENLGTQDWTSVPPPQSY